ncbi:pectinesterase family protein [Enterococcus timonensis]|uniref:pectinesterase family protein n=1 Tax=Enterococcus timonensis TaxID=1852364 RepID=UPI0008D9DF5C|nr:pectinesterase family protein [Enterococcus timonensis]
MAEISPRKIIKKITVGSADFCDFVDLKQAFQQLEPDFAYEITILQGTYQGNLYLYHDDVSIIGLGVVKIIAGKYAQQKEDGQAIGTFQTATFLINAQNIQLENLMIENNAGPGEIVGQAVALYLEGTEISVKNCQLRAHQDTLCLGPLPKLNKDATIMESIFRKRTFLEQISTFENCFIEGTIDFIFGGGTATFFNCELFSKKRPENSSANFLTAPSTAEHQTGLIFVNCLIHGDHPYYLGRPWREFGQATFSDCHFDAHLEVSGWDDWGKPNNQKTARFIEKNNYYQETPQRDSWISFNEKERL